MTSSSAKSSPTAISTASRLLSHRFVLDNGIILLVTPNPTANIVAARFFLRAGLMRENAKIWGLSHLVASVITKGTHQYSAQDIAQMVEAAGASLGTDSAPDYFLASLKTVSEDFETILALAANILQSPTFPAKELATERNVTLQAIKARAEQPLSSALRPLRAAIHGDHPYSQTSYGTLETVESIRVKDLQQFHQTYFRPDDMVISVAGNITPAQAEAVISKYFSDWHPKATVRPEQCPQPLTLLDQLRVLTEVRETQQTIVALGYPAVSVHHPDYIGLKFLMAYLCNGMSSRLFSELREKQGLAYEVSGFYPTRLDHPHFVTYLGTAPHRAERALMQMRAELERLAQGALTEEDLAIAKRQWAGQYALGKQTNRQIAQIYGWHEILGLGDDYDRSFLDAMHAYPLDQVQRIAQTYLANPVCSVVGPADSLEFAARLH